MSWDILHGFGLALVVAGGVEGELADEFAVFVEDADVEVVGEHEDAGSACGASEADVVELAVVAQGDDAAGVDAVVSDPVVPVGDRLAGGVGSGSGGECFGGVRRRSARCGRRVL